MRQADRSCLSDTFYQNFELGSWQQRNITMFLQNKELNSYTKCWGNRMITMFMVIK